MSTVTRGVGPPLLELVDEPQRGGGEVVRRRAHHLERRVDALFEPALLGPLGFLGIAHDGDRDHAVGRGRPRVGHRVEETGVDVLRQDHHAVTSTRRHPVGRHPQARRDRRRSGS